MTHNKEAKTKSASSQEILIAGSIMHALMGGPLGICATCNSYLAKCTSSCLTLFYEK